MQFRLVYEGPLHSTGDAAHKQEVRRALHPQLKALWDYPPLAANRGWLDAPMHPDDISIIRELGGFRFAPLVSEELRLVAELDVVLLRPSPPGRLLRQGGDIDNQLKTLFDALRHPENLYEIPHGDAPRADEDPLFCLLDDDERITDLRVSADRLLGAPDDGHVHVLIFVKTRPTEVIQANLPLA
jgi:hypothetical protein